MSTGYNDPTRCPHCGMFHATTCPRVKAVEYHPDGSVRRVEFHAPVAAHSPVRIKKRAPLIIEEDRDPDPSRPGIFRTHNCSRCQSGAKPCVQGHPNRCEFPHARND